MRTMIQAAALCLIAGSAVAQTAVPVEPACPVTVQPIPTGVNERPGEKIGQTQTPENYGTELDYHWMHSSTNHQGYATTEKFAACLFYHPTEDDLSNQLGGFESALVINNPTGNSAANVRVELYDRNGNLLTTLPVVIPANGTWTRGVPELATLARGVGSARITSDVPVVGATLHHVDSVVIGTTRLTDPHPLHPGANSEQQLQAAQSVGKTLYAGPMPLSNRTSFDFLNGNLPFYCALNTGATPTTVTAYKGTSSGITFPTITTTLPGRGLFIDLSVWQAAEPFYLANVSIDENAWALVASDTHSLVGDVVYTDFFRYGSPTSPSMSPGKRFRMGSAMMANSPAYSVTSAEVTQQLGPVASPQLDTLIGVLNASTTDIGPVTVTYRNRNGGVAGTNTIGSLPAGQTLRLTPGTPGFPASGFFAGSAEVRACKPGLVGWTMREVTSLQSGSNTHFEKAYGEELAGANGREPGNGFRTTVAGVSVNRKVVPVARRMTTLPWPSYQTSANNTVGNIGNYWYRFYAGGGSDITNYAPQPFLGLQFGRTAFSYQDGWTNPLVTPGTGFMSGRVDITNGSVIGMSAIGDPMNEWLIPGYAGTPLGSGGP